jgi:hypothetical protein
VQPVEQLDPAVARDWGPIDRDAGVESSEAEGVFARSQKAQPSWPITDDAVGKGGVGFDYGIVASGHRVGRTELDRRASQLAGQACSSQNDGWGSGVYADDDADGQRAVAQDVVFDVQTSRVVVEREMRLPPVLERVRAVVVNRNPALQHGDVVGATGLGAGADGGAFPAAEGLALHDRR